MKEIILLKNGEIALKGLNRSTFENQLIKNIAWRLKPLGKFDIRKAQSTIYVEPMSEGIDMDEAVERLQKVFGVAGIARARVTEKNMAAILAAAGEYLAPVLKAARTFKVEAKRADKAFPLRSPEICADMGGHLLKTFPHLKVDVHQPQITVTVEVRDFGAYIRTDQLPGAGGMPSGSAGRALTLISGGIDSPVASYMMAKRGIELVAAHFVSPPYTSPQAEQKVLALLKIVSQYSGRIKLFLVPFTDIQKQIAQKCPEDLSTLLMRRFMMDMAARLARQNDCHALITGESLGQVASQTIHALGCTDAACDLPVFRPLIGMDKQEIVSISRKIGTFETSTLPYEDCCTVFTPKHPRTKPRLHMLLDAESLLERESLIAAAMADVRIVTVG